jgi:hypothetical protein
VLLRGHGAIVANRTDSPGTATRYRLDQALLSRSSNGYMSHATAAPREDGHRRSGVVHRQCDTLFPGGVGQTTSPEDFTLLINDVKSRVFDKLSDDTWFYPGHGDDSTLGAERPKLDEWHTRGW